MKLITRKTKAKDAAKSRNSYAGKDPIYQKLLALGDDPDPDDVDHILKSKATSLEPCYECGERFGTLLHFGQDPDYDAIYYMVCASCLKKALELIDGTNNE